MEPENDGLEDDFPLQIWWFLGSMLIFRGVLGFSTIGIFRIHYDKSFFTNISSRSTWAPETMVGLKNTWLKYAKNNHLPPQKLRCLLKMDHF